MLTCCLQAEVVSDLLVVTWVGEVEDAVTRQVNLQNKKTAYLVQHTCVFLPARLFSSLFGFWRWPFVWD